MAVSLSFLTVLGCTSDGDTQSGPQAVPPSANSQKGTNDAVSDELPQIDGLDAAKAVKRLTTQGLEVDLSALDRWERKYARQRVQGYYMSHPRVVVSAYAVGDSRVSILAVKCPAPLEAC